MFSKQRPARRKANSPLADHPFLKKLRRAALRCLGELAGSLFLKRGTNPRRCNRGHSPTRSMLEQLRGLQQLESREMLFGLSPLPK